MKYVMDPCYRAIAALVPPGAYTVDLGSGLGMLPVLLGVLGAERLPMRPEGGDRFQRLLVIAAEADRAAGKLSAESPVAKALLNQPVGATVQLNTPRGPRRLRIERFL